MARKHWTPEQTDIMRRDYPHMPTARVADATGHSLCQCYAKAHKLGLRKTAEYLASPDACRLRRGDKIGGSYRFQKGNESWNKGTHYVAGGRSAETRFKPGRPAHAAHNYMPIGSLRLNKDGYLERKVSDDPTLSPVRRWVAVHRLVWVAAHGEVPAGHAVVFLPGRRTANLDLITLDAIELVTRAELMRRNTVHNLPKPLAQLVQLRGALKRQINRRARCATEETDRE